MKSTRIHCAFLALLLIFSAMTAAVEKKKLAIYNWADYFGESTLADFEATAGATVQYDTFPSPEVLETKLLTGGSGYDVVYPSASLAARVQPAGALAAIDVTKLKNYGNLDPNILKQLAAYTNGQTLGVPYTWGTIGIGYNEQLVKARMPNAPVDNLDILFKPELAAKFADCGIAVLDSPAEVISIVLNYLGLDPNSARAEDIARAQAVLEGLRPHVRYFDTTRPIQDLASGEICLALIYSGDAGTAQLRAGEAGSNARIAYSIPVQGTLLWMDLMAIPRDAPDPELAYTFIDYMLQPKVIAGVTNLLTYANANAKADQYVAEEIRNNKGIYPPNEVRQRLFPDVMLDGENLRLRTRAWTRVKSGL
jgi:putrescine transport system substrate-binding protein